MRSTLDLREKLSLNLACIEFRRHRDIDNPLHIIGFLSQWKMYLDVIPKDRESANQWRGRKLDPTVFEKVNFCIPFRTIGFPDVCDVNRQMSNEQIGQLYELMHATKEIWKTPEELEAGAREEEARVAGGDIDTEGRSKHQ